MRSNITAVIRGSQKLFSYVDKYKEAGIQVRPGMPDYRELDKIYKKYDWSNKVYGTQHEEFPINMPKPLGGMMRITNMLMPISTLT